MWECLEFSPCLVLLDSQRWFSVSSSWRKIWLFSTIGTHSLSIISTAHDLEIAWNCISKSSIVVIRVMQSLIVVFRVFHLRVITTAIMLCRLQSNQTFHLSFIILSPPISILIFPNKQLFLRIPVMFQTLTLSLWVCLIVYVFFHHFDVIIRFKTVPFPVSLTLNQ